MADAFKHLLGFIQHMSLSDANDAEQLFDAEMLKYYHVNPTHLKRLYAVYMVYRFLKAPEENDAPGPIGDALKQYRLESIHRFGHTNGRMTHISADEFYDFCSDFISFSKNQCKDFFYLHNEIDFGIRYIRQIAEGNEVKYLLPDEYRPNFE